jgi:hypothetical protein
VSEFERLFYNKVDSTYDNSGRQIGSVHTNEPSGGGVFLLVVLWIGALIAGRPISGMAARRRRPGRTP